MATWISGISTLIIAIFTGVNILLIFKIKSKDDEFRQQVSDLYHAIIITNLMSPERGSSDTNLKAQIELFKMHRPFSG